MKRKLLFALLAAEAVFCLLFSFLQARFSGWFSTLVAFPFEQIGAGLRVLSLSGGIGNGIAVVLYIVLSLIPIVIFYLSCQKHIIKGVAAGAVKG